MEESLIAALNANTEAMNNSKRGGGGSSYPDQSLLSHLSVALPGGTRIFQLGKVLDSLWPSFKKMGEATKIQEAQLTRLSKEYKAATDAFEITDAMGNVTKRGRSLEEIQKDMDIAKKNSDKLSIFGTELGKSIAMLGILAGALLTFRQVIIDSAREIGGVTQGQALENLFSTTLESIKSLAFDGQFVRGKEIRKIQSAFADEFGGLLGAGAAKELARVSVRLGIGVEDLAQVERALQGTGREAENTINTFRKVGVGGRVAAAELSKNAAAVARAGGEFNSFIVEGIKNAKRLGLEFSDIESQLAGFSTDFSGTVSSFAELRSVLPGFATDFGQLMETSLFGSTDDYIAQIKQSLLQAGISDVSQLNRAQGQMLQRATGFDEAQISRILAGQEAGPAFQESLDTTRNQLLKYMIVTMATGFGAVTGAIIAAIPFTSVLSTVSAALTGTAAGAAAGAAIGFGVGGLVQNDFVSRPGQPAVPFSPDDTLIGVKDVSDLQTTANVQADMSKLENKMDQLITATRANNMSNGMQLEIKDFDKALLRRKQSEIRNS
jgi:hypothetical protein